MSRPPKHTRPPVVVASTPRGCFDPSHERIVQSNGHPFCCTCARRSTAITFSTRAPRTSRPQLEPRPAFTITRGDRDAERDAVDRFVRAYSIERVLLVEAPEPEPEPEPEPSTSSRLCARHPGAKRYRDRSCSACRLEKLRAARDE